MRTDHAPLQFRRAAASDVPAIVTLVESAYRGDASRAGWTTEADLLDGRRTDPEDVQSCIDRERSAILLGERAGELVACAHVAVANDVGNFGMFSVAPTLQGGGAGSAILAEAERIMRDEWHVATMRMSVIDVRAELLAFYERRGYVRTGETKPFPSGDERFGLPRRSDLRFAILEKVL
jgi:N-acetylglutamate synthase-like GNAT family acetyltransferase